MKNGVINTILNRPLVNLVTSSSFGTWSRLANTFNNKIEHKGELIKDNTGLFGTPELQSHEGFNILKQQCVSATNRLVEEATSQHRSRKMVQIFDDLSDSLCRIADLAEFIRIAHPSNTFVKAAEAASVDVSSVVEKLNTNAELYSALVEVVRNGDKVPTTEMDDHVAKLFLFDFEQSGIHLSSMQRHQVVSLNDRLLQLGQVFVAGSTGPAIVDKKVIPKDLRHIFTIDGNNAIVGGLCADSSNSTLREMTYRIYFCGDNRQDYILNQLLWGRHELAQICGFSTYAHRALKGSTLEDPTTVMEFLNQLSDGLRDRADQDFRIMAKMKQSESFHNAPLAMWDTPYFTKKAKNRMFSVESSEFAPYLSLGTCMEGLNNLTNQLYGIELVVTDLAPGECWADDVYKLGVVHEKEGLLGYIYCDFYERRGKLNQDCHFTIRGGRDLPDGSYQHPIVVLLLNLPLPRWSTPTLLSPGMVDNLFHEMGHALHSMLARTQYQHVTGTRCSTDFAEVPSVLMEYFANDARVIRTFAKHFQTKEPMPEDMLQRLCASKHLFATSEIQMQVFYSVLDQIYHGNHPLEGSTTDVLAKTQEKYYSLPYVPNTTWQLRFSHLVSYGAKYYSYLVSRALASYIWQNYFENDPLNRIQGELYRRNCLAHGGGKPSHKLVTDYLQKPPSTKLLVDSILKDVDKKQKQQQDINFEVLDNF